MKTHGNGDVPIKDGLEKTRLFIALIVVLVLVSSSHNSSYKKSISFLPNNFNIQDNNTGRNSQKGEQAVGVNDSDMVNLQRQSGINVQLSPYNAKGDGVTDDTAAINRAIEAAGYLGALYFPKGVYKLTKAPDFRSRRVIGAGVDRTILVQHTASEAVVITGEVYSYLADMTLQHADRSALSQKVPQGVGVNLQRVGYGSVLERLEIKNVTSGLYCGESLTAGKGNYVFSTSLRDITISAFSHSMSYIRGSNTGNIWSNIHGMNWDNVEQKTKLTATWGMYFQTTSNEQLRQINIEHGIYTTAIEAVDAPNFIIDNIHIEGFVPKGNISSIVKTNYHSSLNIRGLSLTFSTFSKSLSNTVALFQLSDDSTITVNGIEIKDNTIVGTINLRRLIAGGTVTAGANLHIDNMRVTDGSFQNGDYVDPSYQVATPLVTTTLKTSLQ
ncbi:hypothetical protein Back11_32020 [Paenibacillus baekrokdamisoli]|uniref:Rhamnogalacturonase A/B/Epimerase-like pectate lyase domain-containing protein n=1 Tax=Paenibacillus baekrokdamisoli TaxID=1712516 RepID=A0A3G9ISQ5_9BACL|nr:glycosyl hydrolase family 28-related protein [Paenibacillus baekrokdamisoli]MBB3071633.1 hypothetical protein [Paenibacillus baekrokdamisoli]BBH21857.1 hypothetical protein Back11_32020 [Paenibacillus baekrokdamisoli]